jgi:hypothetical protein
MPLDVRECFLNDAEGGMGHRGRNGHHVALHSERRGDRRSLTERREVVSQRVEKSLPIHGRRPQEADQIAQLVGRLADGKSLVHRELRGLRGIVGDLPSRELEPDPDVHQVVLDPVVHLLREAIAIVGEGELLPQLGVLFDPGCLRE